MKVSPKKIVLKKIECFIPESKEAVIIAFCNESNMTRAEFIRRAVDEYIEKRSIKAISKNI